MKENFETEAEIVEIKWSSPQDSPNEQAVIIDLEDIGEITCFDPAGLEGVSVSEEDVGETVEVVISLLDHERPQKTENEPGFSKIDGSEWGYRMTGDIIEIEEESEDSEEKIILDVKGHPFHVKTSKLPEKLDNGDRVTFPNNRVDIQSLKKS